MEGRKKERERERERERRLFRESKRVREKKVESSSILFGRVQCGAFQFSAVELDSVMRKAAHAELSSFQFIQFTGSFSKQSYLVRS